MPINKFENLKNPPAVEAVCDIAVCDDGLVPYSKFLLDTPSLKKQLPVREQMNLFQGAFQIGGALSHTQNRPVGFMYKSQDGKELAQFRVNGFSYNKLAPYKGWSNFLNSALEWWEVYRAANPDLKIMRLGLRFVNVINVPSKNKFSTFFKVGLKDPSKGDLGDINELGYRYISKFENLGCASQVQFGFSGNAGLSSEHMSYVFDIDVYKEDVGQAVDAKTIRLHFAKMREAKNKIFFSTLTEKALEMFR
jgi:uncharacterized protein (TIGR04255 family)